MTFSAWKEEAESPAKLNVTLDVFPPDDTGYHPVDSVVAKLSVTDQLSFQIRSGVKAIRLIVKDKRPNVLSHPPIPRDERNLIVKAAQCLLDCVPEFSDVLWITLHKCIPAESGLGAGSSNAATTIQVLGNYLGISRNKQREIAATIGSDVSLFMTDGMVRMQNYGDVVTPLLLTGALSGVLIRPITGMSTPVAYRALDTVADRIPGTGTAKLLASMTLTSGSLSNDFERVVQAINPHVHEVFSYLDGLPDVHAQLCGSGSTVFACCPDRATGIRIIKDLAGTAPYFKWVQTL